MLPKYNLGPCPCITQAQIVYGQHPIFGGKRWTGSRADMEKQKKGAGSTFVLRTLC